MPHESAPERLENTLGVIIGAFQTTAVFNTILDRAVLPRNVDIYLYPTQAGADALPVYMRGAVDRPEPIRRSPSGSCPRPPIGRC